jgi:hypothetical protein
VPHTVLLGDSIFDNAVYVSGEPALIEQLQGFLTEDWATTLLAVDGHVTADVVTQLQKLPNDATHLVVSCGGNDALGHSSVLSEPVRTVAEALGYFAQIREDFRREYQRMLMQTLLTGLAVAVCTVYDCVPDLQPMAHSALSMFNEVILREAFAAKVPVVDLRLICTEMADFSKLSQIEPSRQGGEKIARVISNLLMETALPERVTRVYT